MSYSQEFMLGEITGKLDTLIKRFDEAHATAEKLEGRVTALEKWRWMVVGGSLAASALVSVLLRVMGK